MLNRSTIFLLVGAFLFIANIAWSQGSGSERILNIDFDATANSLKTGPAVVGNPGDYWNPLHPVEGFDYSTDKDKINDVTTSGLNFANGTPSSAAIRTVNLGGGWTGQWAINDPMFNTINYQYDIKHGNNGQPAFIYISNIDPGSYDLYLYGPIGRYQVSVSGRSYGRKDSSQNEKIVSSATQWVEGVHYQVFSNITISPNDQIEIDLIQSDNPTHDAPISGLQLVPSGTPMVNGVIYGQAAQDYIDHFDMQGGPHRQIVDQQEIVLKNGQKIDGKILEQTDKYVKIDPGIGVGITYYKDEIESIVQLDPK